MLANKCLWTAIWWQKVYC